MAAKRPKRQPLDPRVRYQPVSRDWDWADSLWAETMLISDWATQKEAEYSRELLRTLGVNRERIIRITTSIEIVDEGNDDLVGRPLPPDTVGWYVIQRDVSSTEGQQ